MELAHAENQVVAQAPARRRWRVQFSLGTLIWMTIVAGAVLLLCLTQHEVLRLRQENHSLREQLGILDIGDRGKIHVIAGNTGDPDTSRWRVYVPTDREFVVKWVCGYIPMTGLPSPAYEMTSSQGFRGEFQVEARLIRHASGGLQFRVDHTCGWASRGIREEVQKAILKAVSCDVTEAGHHGTEAHPLDVPCVLRRQRVNKKVDADTYETDPDPCPGLMVWIEEHKQAEGTKP